MSECEHKLCAALIMAGFFCAMWLWSMLTAMIKVDELRDELERRKP